MVGANAPDECGEKERERGEGVVKFYDATPNARLNRGSSHDRKTKPIASHALYFSSRATLLPSILHRNTLLFFQPTRLPTKVEL